MLGFIKKLFQKEETPKEQVRLEELFDWFTNKIKNEVEEINTKIRQGAETIRHETKELEQNLEILEKAEPDPKLNIQQRIKQVVYGHRKNYTRRLRLFLERIKVPEEINHTTAKEYCTIVDEELDQIAKNTIKSYYATQHLFHQQLEELTKNLKNISSLTIEIRKLSKEPRIKKITNIKKDIKEIEKGKIMAKTIAEEMESTKKRKKALEILRQQEHEQLQKIREGEEYENYNSLQNRKNELENQKRLEESKLFNLFSPLDASLKKYERMSIEDTKLIIEYLDYPVKALVQDKELHILKVLENLANNLEQGMIELKDEKKVRTIKAIQKIQEQDLKELVKQYNKVEEELAETDKDINAAGGLLIEERRLKDKLIRIEKDMELANLSIETLQGKIKNMAFDKTQKEVTSGVKELTQIELEII
jgi:hypothetical protein